MIIMPDSEVKLYSNVDITDEKHKLFKTPAAREAYFAQHLFRSNVECSYIKVTDPLTLEIPVEDKYRFNYISFKNKSFENKIIYARVIRDPEYVNNEVVQIRFQVDATTTWLFDVEFEECEIAREHISHGEKQVEQQNCLDYRLGVEFTPEPMSFDLSLKAKRSSTNTSFIDLLDFTGNGGHGIMTDPIVCAIFSQDWDDVTSEATTPAPQLNSKINFASVCSYEFYSYADGFPNIDSSKPSLQAMINNYTVNNCISSILGVYVLPEVFKEILQSTEPGGVAMMSTITIPYNGKNNGKLSRFPYQYLRVTDPIGNAKEYRIEKFDTTLNENDDAECKFGVFCSLNGYPQVVVAPWHYDGVVSSSDPTDVGDVTNYNFDEKMIYTEFPQLAYNTDGYLTWLGSALRGQVMKDTTAAPWAYNEAMMAGGSIMKGVGSIVGGLAGGGAAGGGNALGIAGGAMGGSSGAFGALGDIYWGNQLRQSMHEAGESFAENQSTETVVPDILAKAIPANAHDDYHGGNGSVASLCAYMFNRVRFLVEIIQPTEAILNKYDKFLDKYGYNVYRIGVPRIAYWIGTAGSSAAEQEVESPTFNDKNQTFVKTVNCHVVAPTLEIAKAIETLFNNGHWFEKVE